MSIRLRKIDWNKDKFFLDKTITHVVVLHLCKLQNCVLAFVSADFVVTFAELQTGRSLLEYQAQAKQLFRRMNSNTPTRGSLETGSYLFQFVFV